MTEEVENIRFIDPADPGSIILWFDNFFMKFYP